MPYNVLLVKFNQNPDDFEKSLEDSVDCLSFTRQSEHVSVSQFNEEMAQHKMIGNVFPIVLTTMTRIIAHQRTQIGVLKAVGYKNRTIILHFMSYGFWPVLAGAFLGLVTGPMVIPDLFYPSMTSRYSLPQWNPGFDISFVIVASAMVISSLLVSYLAARNISKENPASLAAVPVILRASARVFAVTAVLLSTSSHESIILTASSSALLNCFIAAVRASVDS